MGGIIKNEVKQLKYKTKNDMIQQVEFSLRPLPRGFHLVTNEVMRNLPALPKTGILNLFVRHTSCGLSLNENFDPDVRHDLKGIFERLVPDGDPRYLHQMKGLRICRLMPNRAWWGYRSLFLLPTED